VFISLLFTFQVIVHFLPTSLVDLINKVWKEICSFITTRVKCDSH